VQPQQAQGRLVVPVLLVQLARELRPAQLNSSRLLQDALQQEQLNQQRHQSKAEFQK
jgi:post-segregation antitoxin (ccd killing protein)